MWDPATSSTVIEAVFLDWPSAWLRMAVDGQPADVGHNTALRRRGAFRSCLGPFLGPYMERGGKGAWEV